MSSPRLRNMSQIRMSCMQNRIILYRFPRIRPDLLSRMAVFYRFQQHPMIPFLQDCGDFTTPGRIFWALRGHPEQTSVQQPHGISRRDRIRLSWQLLIPGCFIAMMISLRISGQIPEKLQVTARTMIIMVTSTIFMDGILLPTLPILLMIMAMAPTFQEPSGQWGIMALV